jgi:fucose permease
MLAGAVFMAFAAGGYLAWFVDFLITVKGMSDEQAFIVFAAAMFGGLVGVVTGGIVADRLRRRFVFGRQAAVAVGFAAAVPCALGAIFLDVGVLFYVSAWMLMFFVSWYHGPIAAAVDDLVTQDRAATAQASYILLMHLLGTAPASYVVGVAADEIGLELALLLPTATMGLAAIAFAGACRSVSRNRVVKEPAS